MAKMTIAQLREKEVIKLANYQNGFWQGSKEPTDDELKQAKTFLNRYYRLAALSVRNFEDDNDERRYNTRWHKENEEKEERLFNRLNSDLFEKYGLNIAFTGLYPSIVRKGNMNGIDETVIYGHFY